MGQQREPEPSSFPIRGLWNPAVVVEGDQDVHLEPTARDRYGVIDEIIEDVVRLAVALWPEVDVAGRLRFGTEESQDFAYDRAELQSVIDTRRQSERQVQRPLRVGDVFFIRGFDEASPASWLRVVDVTKAGRRAAKHAGLRAVAQPTEPEAKEAARPDLSWRQPPDEAEVPPEQLPPPFGSTVNPAV
jgi:hypothetical protein